MGDLPAWVPKDVPWDATFSPEELMALAVSLAAASARHGGGPFGAVVADPEGRVIEVGWNDVVRAADSTAHAEIVAMRRAQARLGTHRLEGLTLYSSCAPCIQCFGAIYWSGLARVLDAATKEDAEALGFEEGPPMMELWAQARRAKGIERVERFARDERALEPFRAYRARGGVNYSRE